MDCSVPSETNKNGFPDIPSLLDGIVGKEEKFEELKKNLYPHIRNLYESGKIVMQDVTPSNCKFSRGDLVYNVSTDEIGFIVGPLNSYPKDTKRVLQENKRRDPRYLTVVLSPSHPDFGEFWKEVTGKDRVIHKADLEGAIQGYFSVRYPSERNLVLLLKHKNENHLQEIANFCKYNCVLDCDKDCPFSKYEFIKNQDTDEFL